MVGLTKDPVPKDQARGVIYSTPCKDCDELYIGETKRKFNTRLREHQKTVEQKHPKKSALAEHCLQSGHTISFSPSLGRFHGGSAEYALTLKRDLSL